MKYHLGFIGILLIAVISFIYLAVTLNEQDLFYFHGNHEDVIQLLTDFRQNHRAEVEVNFTALYGGRGQFQILHPLLELQNLNPESLPSTCTVAATTRTGSSVSLPVQMCETRMAHANSKDPDPEISSRGGRKQEVLERYTSDEMTELPEDFIITPPFVSPLGRSFAYLLVLWGRPPFNRKPWVEEHLSYFKVSELKDVLKKFQIPNSQFSLISGLQTPEIEEIIRGAPALLTSQFLLIKNQTRLGFSPLSYFGFRIADFNEALKGGSYEFTTYSKGDHCLQRIGNICWNYNSKHTLAYLYRYALTLFILIGVTFFAILCTYISHIYKKTLEQQKQRLALQVLSHEFRTPLSTMLLTVDQLTKNPDRLSLADQDLVTRMSAEAFRLQRIIEVSKTYLQADGHRIHFESSKIASLNNWLSDFLIEFPLVDCELLPHDRSLQADAFWLRFILSNLVQNAMAHGKPPIVVRAHEYGERIHLTVEDHGHCAFDSLKQMTAAFVKNPGSKGMGLGLNIAKLIADQCGGEIRFSASPTAFTFVLGKQIGIDRAHTHS